MVEVPAPASKDRVEYGYPVLRHYEMSSHVSNSTGNASLLSAESKTL